ncbi:hypothetical protein MLD38_009289 [Melastoma candidum]|uniref:Uncharacterized protein n=1 Tax=Melastoma candidum TaxID=119954 RepID=A0ACB9RX25_9MYRT|nr:hypothetical protein MLD38_009289 [Melastoma candidum]
METASKDDRSFERSLHAVRKAGPSKPYKKPTASLPPPSATKIYKVAPIEFKELVQKLTGASTGSRQLQRLRAVAPPPVDVVPPEARPVSERCSGDSVSKEREGGTASGTPMTPLSAFFKELSGMADGAGHGMELGLGLSPTPGRWFQFPLSSPVGCPETTTFL